MAILSDFCDPLSFFLPTLSTFYSDNSCLLSFVIMATRRSPRSMDTTWHSLFSVALHTQYLSFPSTIFVPVFYPGLLVIFHVVLRIPNPFVLA